MKTPEEIKKALELCADGECDGCNYLDRHTACECLYKLTADALEYIQQLEAALTEAKNDGMECIVEEEMW